MVPGPCVCSVSSTVNLGVSSVTRSWPDKDILFPQLPIAHNNRLCLVETARPKHRAGQLEGGKDVVAWFLRAAMETPSSFCLGF